MHNNKVIISSLTMLLLTGCVMQPKFTDKEKNLEAPKIATSNYSQAYNKFNTMMKLTSFKNLTVQVATVKNATTGKLQYDIKHFIERPLIESISHMNVMAYDPAYQQNEIAVTGSRGRENWADYVIVGEISQYDKATYSEGSDIDVDGQFGKGKGFTTATIGSTDGFSKSSITVDLKIKKTNGIYDSVVSNSIELYQKNKSNSIGIFLNNIGLGISKNANMKQSTDQALRLVSEYGLIQLLGRFYNLPYWKCFEPNMPVDEKIISTWYSQFNQYKNLKMTSERIEILLSQGYNAPFVKVDNNIDKNELKTIQAIRNHFNIKVQDINSADFYIELYKNAPIFKKMSIFDNIKYRDNIKQFIVKKKVIKKKIVVKKKLPTQIIIQPTNEKEINFFNDNNEVMDNFFQKKNTPVRRFRDKGTGNLILID